MVDLLETFNTLNLLYESNARTIFPAAKPDLSKCKLIKTDVVDIRGEYETNSCLLYSPDNEKSPILTRVQVRTLILKEIEGEYFVLGRKRHGGMYLPGGGYDLTKDNGDPCKTAEREAWEEFNFRLTDIKNPQLYSWSYREDSFVSNHVAKEEDRWTGYLTILITAKYAGISDNDKPEELNEWKWYPVKDFEHNNFYKQGLQSISLLEAVHPDKEGRSDLGKVSYLCDSLETLRLILSHMEIQKTYVKEVRYELANVRRGRRKATEDDYKQYSVSTSTNLTGHAERRPDRWGFGVVLDGARLSKYYDIEPYNHAHFTLPKQYITKIVKLKDGRVIITISYYGNREIKNGEWLYDYVVDYIDSHANWAQKARKLDYYAMKNGTDAWRFNPFKGDTRFETIKPSEVEDIRAFISMAPSQNCLPLKELDRLPEILDHLAEYSNFNEEEERIWLEDELLNFVQIPKDTLIGIILPEFFKEDYELSTPTNIHLAWLKDFVSKNNLEVIWHQAINKAAYEKELAAGQQETAEQDFDSISKGLEPEAIVEKAKRLANQLSLHQLRQLLPVSQVATAVVKKAINQHMQNLTAANYQQKYDLAYKQAINDGFDCKLLSNKVKLADALQNLFNYYCPDRPK